MFIILFDILSSIFCLGIFKEYLIVSKFFLKFRYYKIMSVFLKSRT